jgi:hypothetical protein
MDPRTKDTDPGVFPPPPAPLPPPPPRFFQIASTIAALAAVVAGIMGNIEWMLWLSYASILLNLVSLGVDGCWVMDTDPGVWPPPPRPYPILRLLQSLALLLMVGAAVAGVLGQDETFLILATVSLAANALSLWLEGGRRTLRSRGPQTTR